MFTAPCIAGEKRYRVEILVLSHIQHEAIPAEAEWLRDFSDSLDFLTPEDDEEAEEEAEDDEATLDEDQPQDPWANVVVVEERSDVMREAWRRLRLSAPFRPEQYLSWEQSADPPFPALRLHDLEVVLIDDSFADLGATDAVESGEEEDIPVVFSDPGNLLPADGMEESTGEAAEDPTLPDPTLFYRLDGTVMLRRLRFLHLDLDLELRQAVFDEPLLTPVPSRNDASESGEPKRHLPTSFLIHTLNQSRQVKSHRMEYFDSPVLGVLVWITPFELEDEADDEAESLSD